MRVHRPALLLALLATLTVSACGTGSGRDTGSTAGAPSEQSAPRAPEGDAAGVDTTEDSRSTFALDIDTASYGYASRLIKEGRVPDRASIRPEEFINAFNQEYPEPEGNGFAIHVDGARPPGGHRAEGGDRTRLLRVGLRTRSEENANRRDAALTFVIDVSGSMAERGRLDLVQDALHTLVDQLRAGDSVAIVTFSDNAHVVRRMTRIAGRGELHDAIDELRPRNGTNLEAGLTLGYRIAREGFRPGATNRVVILSDGLANIGGTEADPILAQVREQAEKEIALLGVGVGSDYGDQLMERLADRGDGFVVYVSEREQARKVFVDQLPATLTVRAQDARVQVTFDPEAVRSYRLVGYTNRAIADRDFRNDKVDGGEIGPGHSVTALYEIQLAGTPSGSTRLAQVDVRWVDPATREPAEAHAPVTASTVDGGFDQASPRLWVVYAAGFFGEALQGAPDRAAVRRQDLVAIAGRAADRTDDPQVRELTGLIERADWLD